MPLIPGFRQGDIDRRIDRFAVSIEQRIIWALAMVGENFVNDARTIRTYKDQTGNLRSSIGYIIARDGNIIQENIEGKAEGRAQAKETAEEVLRENSKGFVLIVVAGMEYAANKMIRQCDRLANKKYNLIMNDLDHKEGTHLELDEWDTQFIMWY